MRTLMIVLSWLLIVLSSPCYAWHLTADPQPIWNAFNDGVLWYEVDVDGTVYTRDTHPAVKAVSQGDETVKLHFNLDWLAAGGPYSIKVRPVNPVSVGSWTAAVTVTRNVDGTFTGSTGTVPQDSCCMAILP